MTAGTPNVLLVNPPPRLREALALSAEGCPRPYGLRTAGNLQEAITVLTQEDIFGVLVTVETAETVGDHLLREIRAGYPNIDIVVILPEGGAGPAAQIPDDLNVQVLCQPVDLASLARYWNERAGRRTQGFAGTLKNIQIDDLIQMCCLSMTTISIRVAQNNHQGIIYIRDGEIVHAVCGDHAGEEAFYTILGWVSGRFETLDDRYDDDNTINKSHEFLLMEAARRADEALDPENDAPPPATPEATVVPQRERLKVLLVEDSTLMSKILSSMLMATGEIEVVGTAVNGQDALEMAHRLAPDLILLDVNMPVMDGSTALKHIMIRTPCPVVVISNVGSGSPEAVMQFLDLGAADFMAKPVKNKDLLLQQQKIVERIRRAARAEIANFRRYRPTAPQVTEKPTSHQRSFPSDQLLVVLSGCSGHGALTQLLAELPDNRNLAVVILQTIPPVFLPALAAHLAKRSVFQVTPLTDGAPLRTGCCYLGTPGHALRAVSTGRETLVEIPAHRPAAGCAVSYLDLFLCSAVDCYPGSLKVAVLSGADTGNLEGLRYIKERGARIVLQDPAACMMPETLLAVTKARLSDAIVTPEEMAGHISDWAGESVRE